MHIVRERVPQWKPTPSAVAAVVGEDDDEDDEDDDEEEEEDEDDEADPDDPEQRAMGASVSMPVYVKENVRCVVRSLP